MTKFNTENDLRLTIKADEKEILLDEVCCTSVNIILKNDGQIMTSFLGAHNPEIIKDLERTLKLYFKGIKKALKAKPHDEHCCCGDEDCNGECHEHECHCGDDCHCHDGHNNECKCGDDCKCHDHHHDQKNICKCTDGEECICEEGACDCKDSKKQNKNKKESASTKKKIGANKKQAK